MPRHFVSLATIFSIIIVVFSIVSGTNDVSAAPPTLSPVLTETGLGGASPVVVTLKIVSVVLSVLGLITLVMIIWAGFSWMLSGGNSEKMRQARDRLVLAVIGLAIVMASYGIAKYVFDQIVKATT